MFTALPILFMIMIAFTNMDGANNGRNNLFGWIGMDNFNQILAFGGDDNVFAVTFGEILAWTLMWAFFATFSNYFLGMAVAMIINKKGIKFKKVWRTILVMTIAIPQFVSLLYVSHLFDNDGAINGILLEWGWIETRIPFWTNMHWARALVILINIWIGIPYLMLIATGILMNIPEDLYESARIDGANAFQQYMKITLPYMLFVTGPYLLTSFIGNINNFNVIFLLSQGGPTNDNAAAAGGAAGYTDLLVTWLFKMTSYDSNYKRASVIGIMIFLVVAVISLIVYNLMPSTRNEEDFS
jgi:arabinogalactan oligomer/maltooligosaccharide transport system permease protein